MLALSACKVDDPEETEKIQAVATGLDRLFSLLQLQGAYDSNQYAERLFVISAEIREKPASQIPAIFQKHLIEELKEHRDMPDLGAFNSTLFKPMSIDRLNTRFVRYLFARVEMILAQKTKQEMRHILEDLVTRRGWVNGFHSSTFSPAMMRTRAFSKTRNSSSRSATGSVESCSSKAQTTTPAATSHTARSWRPTPIPSFGTKPSGPTATRASWTSSASPKRAACPSKHSTSSARKNSKKGRSSSSSSATSSGPPQVHRPFRCRTRPKRPPLQSYELAVRMCNAYNHPPSCTCGWGGEGHAGRSYGGWSYTPPNRWLGIARVWREPDFARPPAASTSSTAQSRSLHQ
jgi:hypothetical protein